MEIDFPSRRLSIGIREFVSFAQGSYPSTPLGNAGNWRTQLGQHWHQQLWEESANQFGEQAQREIAVKGILSYSGWEFELSGRIDQLIRDAGELIIREVKTTQQVIPLPVAELQAIFPDYFEQLACYQLLLGSESIQDTLRVVPELLMLHIDTGIRQTVHPESDPNEILKPRFEAWVDFLDGQQQRDDRVRHLVVPAAFETFREDQIPVRDALFRLLEPEQATDTRFITLQAATGFGKSGIAVEWALHGLRKRLFNRVIYITGKNTGQVQVLAELKRFRDMAAGLRFFQIRNMETHLGICPHLGCPCRYREGEGDQLESFIPYPVTQKILEEGSPSMDVIEAQASERRLCPRLVSQSCLSHTEFWVGDYNYVFSGKALGMLESIPGFNPKRTLLIVDETHNLHERVASNYSAALRAFSLNQLLQALRNNQAPRSFQGAVEQLLNFCNSQDEQERLDPTEEYRIRDLLEAFRNGLMEAGSVLSKLPDEILEWIWELLDAYQVIQKSELNFLYWVPIRGTVRITCLDASKAIRETLDQYRKVLFMSATFPPDKEFTEQTGIQDSERLHIGASSPWRQDAYSVAVDCRVNTTYKRRKYFYQLTSDTLAQLARYTTQPVVTFFPSYQYAETVAEYLRVAQPHLRVVTLPRELKAEQQIEAIEDSVYACDVYCLPLGSGLSEGIDVLGGKVDTIMVVSPALPEVNAVQNAKSELFSNKQDAFHSVYLVPGLTKVNQALGRIVRDPQHRAKVLLHCDRFAQEAYRTLLSEEYQTTRVIRSETDLEDWLNACQQF